MEKAGCLLELLCDPHCRFLAWLILLPISLVLATPGVLFLAFFGADSYLANVGSGYGLVITYWERLGPFPPS